MPAASAQAAADGLIRAGVRAILNFAPATIRAEPTVWVRNVSFIQEMAVLSYCLGSDGGCGC